jgi:hypothetical protein
VTPYVMGKTPEPDLDEVLTIFGPGLGRVDSDSRGDWSERRQ